MGIIEKVEIKAYEPVGLRLVLYEGARARIDLFDLATPSEALFEGHYLHQENALEQFNELETQSEAVDWAYRNS